MGCGKVSGMVGWMSGWVEWSRIRASILYKAKADQ